MQIKVVISAGGMGKRLEKITNSIIPKGLCRIVDKTLISYQLFEIKKLGIKDVLISAENEWQIAELNQLIRIKELPKLRYFFDKHPSGHPLNIFISKKAINFIHRNDFIWTYGDLFYKSDLLRDILKKNKLNKTSVGCILNSRDVKPLNGILYSYDADKNGRIKSYYRSRKPKFTIDAPFLFKNSVLMNISEELLLNKPRSTRLVNRLIDIKELSVVKPNFLINMNNQKDFNKIRSILIKKDK